KGRIPQKGSIGTRPTKDRGAFSGRESMARGALPNFYAFPTANLGHNSFMPLKIDLHTHSYYSGDGVSSPEEMIAAARKKGLHGIALTDHNTCEGIEYLLEEGLMRPDGEPVNDFLIIPGVEVTTAEGHL